MLEVFMLVILKIILFREELITLTKIAVQQKS
ncbi:hypothetical protein BH20ACI4_BH20ACI4_11710 [soil metagenome]